MAISRGSTQTTLTATAVQLDGRGIPAALIGGGHHTSDIPRNRRPGLTNLQTSIPMEEMRNQVALNGLKRPTVNKYVGKRKRS